MSLTRFCAVFAASLLEIQLEIEHVSRKSPNPGRRQGPSQGPGRVQAGDRREIRAAILHHESRWGCCSSVSLRGMGTDRTEAGRAFELQSHEEKVSGTHQLLGAAGRDGWAGQAADSAVVARGRADQRRSCRGRVPELSGSQEPGSLYEEDSAGKVHA